MAKRDERAVRQQAFHHKRIDDAATSADAMRAGFLYLSAVIKEVERTKPERASRIAADLNGYLCRVGSAQASLNDLEARRSGTQMAHRGGAPTRAALHPSRQAAFHQGRLNGAATLSKTLDAGRCFLAAVAAQMESTNPERADQVAADVLEYIREQVEKHGPSASKVPLTRWINYLRGGTR